MLTQNRTLNTISDNIANTNTNGYKAQRLTSRTFGDIMIERIDSQRTPIGHASLMNLTADKAVTDFSQGAVTPTDRTLDFAISGDGFFAVRTNGGVAYTRNGSFNLDTQGYLTLNGVGRVLGRNGQPILLGTDNVQCDGQGNLSVGGAAAGSVGVFRFPNNAALNIVNEGLYSGANATAVQAPQITWKAVEASNADMANELTQGIASQRGLQTCSEALKMYDLVLDKAVDIGKV